MRDRKIEKAGRNTEGDHFELALTRAMRRVEAPAGFAERVMAEAASRPAHDDETVMNGAPRGVRVFVMPRPKVWLSGAIAAALVAGVFVAQDVHQRHEREVANRQFALSMQIEERAMEHTRQQLEKAGVPLE